MSPLWWKCRPFQRQLQAPSNCNNHPLLCNHWEGLLNADPKLQNAMRVMTQPNWIKTRKQCIRNITELPVCSQPKKAPVRTAIMPTMAVRRANMLCEAVNGSCGLKPAGCSQLRSLGLLSVPNVTQGGPAWNSRTTLRRANAITSLKCAVVKQIFEKQTSTRIIESIMNRKPMLLMTRRPIAWATE